MEANSSGPVSLRALAYSPILSSTSPYTKNAIVKKSLKIWVQFRRYFGLQSFSINAPLAANHIFQPSLVDGAFLAWSDLGIETFKDLFVDNIFASFQQLSDKYSIPRQQFFRYLQVRSFVCKTFPTFPNLPGNSAQDIFLAPVQTLKGSISRIYDDISCLRPESLNTIKARWEEDLGEEITEDTWDAILLRVHGSSICARHSLIQCKLLHRIYYTKARLSKIYDNVSAECDRCHQSPADLMHMFWLCPSIHNYWTEVFRTLSGVVGQVVEPTPFGALFGVFPLLPSLTKSEKDVLAFITLLARRLILLNWKSPTSPSHAHLIRDTLHCVKLEKIRYLLQGSNKKFGKV